MEKVCGSIRISGRVQGVGYRYFAQSTALSLGLCGWVRNLPDGDVEIEVEGLKQTIEQWLITLEKGPLSARIDRLSANWKPFLGTYNTFLIT